MADIPEVFYNGDYITCYPSSNAKDDGKLNLEFNMARLVTRVSSKNFCIVKPSYVLSVNTDEVTGDKTIKIDIGQASINGMDLIMTQPIYINPPLETNKKFYLSLKLHRDRSDNVRGDDERGVDKTFAGVSATYFEGKDESDKDRLDLGTVVWNGTDFTELEEDEDKYGRIWAEDILCKLLDPKHPDDRRLLLQDWLYKVPDWYFSKEGDTIYGPLTIVDNRENNNPGILVNVTEDGSKMIIKDPKQDNSLLQFYGDLNRDGVIDTSDLTLVQNYVDGTGTLTDLQQILADVNGDGKVDEKDLEYIKNFINNVEGVSYGKTGEIYFIDSTSKGLTYTANETETSIGLADSEIKSTADGNWDLEINSENNIKIHSNEKAYIQGDKGVEIGSGGNSDTPKLTLNQHKATITDTRAPSLKFDINFVDVNTIQQMLGKAVWQYKNGVLSLLDADTTLMDINPNTTFRKNIRVVDTITIGNETDTNQQTTISKINTTIKNGDNTNILTPSTQTITTNGSTNGSILITKKDNSSSSKLEDTGKLSLINKSTGTPQIYFSQGATASDVILSKVKDKNTLNLQGSLTVSQSITATSEITGSGLTTSNGKLTFKNGTNDATIQKDSGNSLLYTSKKFNVGKAGNQAFKAGVSTFSGNVTVGSASNGVQITTGGDINAANTITGKKVLRCCIPRYL